MIRAAESRDIEAITSRMAMLADATGNGSFFDAPLFSMHVASAIATPEKSLVTVLQLGRVVRGFLMAELGYTRMSSAMIAQEHAFWIDEGARGKFARPMLDHFEGWAAKSGAAGISVSVQAFEPRVGLLYERRGYRETETRFTKTL